MSRKEQAETGTEKIRDSGIELLKIISMLFIITFHMISTIRFKSVHVSYDDYVIKYTVASTNVRNIILMLLSSLGALGNNIFFICSAWFLVRSSKANKKKLFYIIAEVWIISIIIFSASYIYLHGAISFKNIVKSVFPTTFASNWYVTCYILFYPLHPILNNVIDKLSKRSHLRITLVMFILYCCMGMIKDDMFFSSKIIVWIAIYFLISYMCLYMKGFSESIKKNVILLCVGIAGFVLMILSTNFLGLHMKFFRDKVLHWSQNYNPFIILTAIAAFNIMRHVKIKSKAINYISSMSLLIYVIHENVILRLYFRPRLLQYIYKNFGYSFFFIKLLVLVLLVFLSSLIVSVVFDISLRRLLRRICDKLYSLIRKLYLKTERFLLKLH